jgi:hypothetical protein
MVIETSDGPVGDAVPPATADTVRPRAYLALRAEEDAPFALGSNCRC